jgi:hypothetical protein
MTQITCLTPKTALLRFLAASEGGGQPAAPLLGLLASAAAASLLLLNLSVSSDASALKPKEEVRG